MSDRVLFATNNDSVTPSNSSGFNGFPFPSVAAGADVSHPIAVSLADCIEMYWRIKNWNISTDIAISDSSTMPPTTDSMPIGDMAPSGSNATRELDLIFPIQHEWDLSSPSWTEVFLAGGAINDDSGTFYPFISLTSTFGSAAVVSFNPSVVGSPYVPAGSFTGSVLGYPITVYMFTNSTEPTISISGSFLDLTPVEWWPYAAKDGSPIYNTSTGAQLQSPLN